MCMGFRQPQGIVPLIIDGTQDATPGGPDLPADEALPGCEPDPESPADGVEPPDADWPADQPDGAEHGSNE